ncbi:MAG: tannase/feruloyl esterase family alpha/beta hydrolase [Bryobacterales bacterium]|nr:tannase/feruloyl esterase family alpha/beta hydrolase [Bryobacterales bacterium]MDE0622226.1 tannase/feruloyl esterase family alpha/beta hydrolase [Bryobacterales bacterium]
MSSTIRLAVLLAASSLTAGTLSALDCSALAELRLPDIRIQEAAASRGEQAQVETLPEGVPSLSSRATVPHCKVTGIIGSEIRFEVLLPDDWNGKFLMGGGGGFVGSLGYQGRFSVNRGYATAATDTGHQGNGIRADWAYGQPERRINYGYLGVHRTTEAAKAIVRAYYGESAERAYFMGCSNGGRQALMSAQRFPDDFDGIVAGAPAHDFSGVLAAFAYNMQRIFPDPGALNEPVITPQNRQLLESEILRRCDARDGVADGFLNDPRDCDFQLSDLPVCAGEAPSDNCLTIRQREAIAAVYGGPRNAGGQIYPGFPFGGESAPSAWQSWITGPSRRLMTSYGEPSSQFGFATQGFKYLIFQDPEFDYSTYDFDDYGTDAEHLEAFLDATDPDLTGFRQAGGKLLLWHGWSDAALTALGSIDYFEAAEGLDPDVRDYFRFYLMPGVFHCAGGPGPDRVDWLDALESWVEDGDAPESLTAVKVTDGKIASARPLCVYPERAEYAGGDPNQEASYSCKLP